MMAEKRKKISIHALRGEGDGAQAGVHGSKQNFYPRPPRGGRPERYANKKNPERISIHALRGEGDVTVVCKFSTSLVFLSTPSAGRATGRMQPVVLLLVYFYPRPPRGGRQVIDQTTGEVKEFLSTPSAGRATFKLGEQCRTEKYFYPRPPRGGRHNGKMVCFRDLTFLSTPSAGRATWD